MSISFYSLGYNQGYPYGQGQGYNSGYNQNFNTQGYSIYLIMKMVMGTIPTKFKVLIRISKQIITLTKTTLQTTIIHTADNLLFLES